MNDNFCRLNKGKGYYPRAPILDSQTGGFLYYNPVYYWVGNTVISLISARWLYSFKVVLLHCKLQTLYDIWQIAFHRLFSKKKFLSFFVYLLFCVHLKCRFQTVIFVTFHCIISEKVTSKQAWKKLYAVYGEKSLTERQCQNWFARFRCGGFHLKDAPYALDIQLKLTTTK